MSPEQVVIDKIQALRRASRVSATLALLGGGILIGSVFYSATRLKPLEEEAHLRKRELQTLVVKKDELVEHLKQQELNAQELLNRIEQLEKDQQVVLSTIGQVLDPKQIAILDKDINFEDIKSDFAAMSPGRRKQAVMVSILMAWKQIPFSLSGTDVLSGMDSSAFLTSVLEKVGIHVPRTSAQRPSEALMDYLQKVDVPELGDIAMYKGEVGYYGLIYISHGAQSGAPIGVGTLGETKPLQIRSLNKGNRKTRPFVGYFRVPYEKAAG